MPKIVHVATHGFYVDNLQEAFPNQFPDVLSIDILSRYSTGLLLSNSSKAWEGALPYMSSDNNILTAREIEMMDFFNKELVILTACNSGIGPEHNGIGVASLTEAFLNAGAKYVISTSWEVDDMVAKQFAQMFYYCLSVLICQLRKLFRVNLNLRTISWPR